MKKLTSSEVNALQSFIDSLQFEVNKAKSNGGYVAPSYIKEKTAKINAIVKDSTTTVYALEIDGLI